MQLISILTISLLSAIALAETPIPRPAVPMPTTSTPTVLYSNPAPAAVVMVGGTTADPALRKKTTVTYPSQSDTSEVEDDYIVNVRENAGILFELVPMNGAPSQATSFLQKLATVAWTAPDVDIVLGFVLQGAGNIQRKADGAVLQSVYLSTRACSTTCRPNDVDGLSFPLENWANATAKVLKTGISDSKGICGELTVVHGLFWKEIVDPSWKGVVNGKYWDDDYVYRVWKKAGSSEHGTSIADQKSALGASWNTVWYGSADSIKDPTLGITFPYIQQTLQDWCNDLIKATADGKICAMSLAGKKSAHMMPMSEVKWEKNKGCVIQTFNTGTQGNPMGKNVPQLPGSQTWEISGSTQFEFTVDNTSGSNKAFWNSRKYNAVEAYCLREYQYFWTSKPERKGAAWD